MAITGELSLVQQILVKALKYYRESFSVINNIRHAVENAPKEQNATVRFPMAKRPVAKDVVPGPTAGGNGDIDTDYRDLKLSHWRDADFVLNDTQFTNLNEVLLDQLVSRSMETLGQDVETKILNLYKKCYAFAGVPGTTPFGSNHSDATEVRKIMNLMNVPKKNRVMMLGPDAEASALNLPIFAQANTSGSDQAIKEGFLGRKIGFDWRGSNSMPAHTTVGSADWLVNGAAQTGKQLIVDAGTTAPTIGDVFTVAGDSQTYVIDAVAGNTWTIEPEMKVAPADNAAVTFKGSHEVNMAWDRDAIGVMFAPFSKPAKGQSSVQSIVDPDSGIPIRLEIIREYKQWRFVFDILYGTEAIHRDGFVRLAG